MLLKDVLNIFHSFKVNHLRKMNHFYKHIVMRIQFSWIREYQGTGIGN